MEKFATIENAQELFEFLSSIPESVRTQLILDVYEEVDDPDEPTCFVVDAAQIFEDGVPISMCRISKANTY